MRIHWWTLALQTVNVLVLIWILARFFFRPVADIIAKRQTEAADLLARAAAAREAAQHARDEVEKARTQIDAERDRLIAVARESVQLEKTKVLAQATQEIAKLHSDAKAAIAQERVSAQDALIARACDLSIDIAKRLLARLPLDVGLSAFLDGLRRELQSLPIEIRQGLASGKEGAGVEIVTPGPLSEHDKQHVSTALEQVLGSTTPMTFRSDPGVIAGIEIHSRTTIVRNSWRADLERLREELSRAQHSGQV